MDEDEAAFSMTICYFERMNGEPALVVGTGVGVQLAPRSCREGWLRVYAIKEQGRLLEFMHKVSCPSQYLDLAHTDGNRPRRTMFRHVSPDSRDLCSLV